MNPIEFEFRNPHIIIPPGSLYQILSRPFTENEVMELAIFAEHRYAFFFWNKWFQKKKLNEPPCLVSLDWHQDLCFPCDTEKEWLQNLDCTNDGEVAVFSWAQLAGNNDGQILSAAYLNLIGNVYVHCRGGYNQWEDEILIDMYGNEHIIKKFKTYENLEKNMLESEEEHVFFDIDLDFFTLDNPLSGRGEQFTYMDNEQIAKFLDIDRPLIRWIFERIQGFTIATEPEFCGGLLKSNELLDCINSIYFEPSLFAPSYTKGCDWKHKK